MQQSMKKNQIGMVIGYILAVSVATIILYSILKILHKLPSSWNILSITGIVILIAALAAIIKRLTR